MGMQLFDLIENIVGKGEIAVCKFSAYPYVVYIMK